MGHYILAGDGSLIVERRATPRYDVAIAAQVTLEAGNRQVDGMITNLSESGVQVVVSVELQDGNVLAIRAPSFEGSAQVMWWREEGAQVRAGLKFVTLASKDREAIRNLLSGLRQKEEGARMSA